jgi:hypothetical protein
MTLDEAAVVARLLAIRDELEAKVWPTAVEAAASDDHERIRDLVKLKVDIEAIDFALGHRPTGIPEGRQT